MKKVILIIISFFLLINNTKALTFICPEVASPNEIIECQLEETEYIGIKANNNFDNSFTYKNLTLNTGKIYYSSTKGFSIGNINQEKLTLNLELKVEKDIKLDREYELELTNIEAVDKNYQNIKLNNIKSNKIKILSNVNTLKNLEVSNEKITPNFKSDILEYNISTYNGEINIIPTKTDELSTITGDIGPKKLNLGANTFKIIVTSQRRNEKTYYLYVTRKTKNNDITLKKLSISNKKIDLVKNKFIYTTTVDYDVENVTIEAIPNNNKSTIKIDKPNKLEIGKNNITIIITAEDGTIGTYSIIVTRRDNQTVDNNIKDKTSNDDSIKDKQPKDNNIKDNVPNNSNIKNIIIKGYELNFKSDIYNYILKINEEEKLDIEVVLNDSKTKYTIEGNSNLKNNSIITITTISEDKKTEEYKITIKKNNQIDKEELEQNKQSKDKQKSSLSKLKILPIIIFIVLITLKLILKIIKDKQRNKK